MMALVLAPVDVVAENLVTGIKIAGNVNVKEGNIQRNIALKIGDDLDQRTGQDAVQKSIENLYAEGLFENVLVDTAPADNGAVVTFTIQERPLIVHLAFTGNKKYKAGRLRDELEWKPDKFKFFLRPETKEKYRKKLLEFYRGKGYSNIDVFISETYLANNQVMLNFQVVEGKKLRIIAINFVGNQAIPGDKILKILKTKIHHWYWWQGHDPATLEEDQENIKALYAIEGYIDAEVEIPKPVLTGERDLVLTIRITENMQYRLGQVRFSGNTVFSSEELLSKFRLQSGDIFNMQIFQQDGQKLQETYRAQGYLRARAMPRIVRDTIKGLVDVEVNIYEGNRFHLRDLRLEGVAEASDGSTFPTDLKTKPNVIRREFDLEGGDVLDWTQVKEAERRLINLGYFERDESKGEPALKYGFDVEYDPVVDPELADLTLRLQEMPTGHVSIGGGYAASSGPSLFLEFSETNLFGRGYKLDLNGSLGEKRTSGDIGIFNPHLYDSPWGGGLRFYHRIQQSYGKYSFQQQRTGSSLRLTRHLSRTDLIGAEYALEQVVISDTEIGHATIEAINGDYTKHTVPPELREGNQITSALTLNWSEDTRDYVMFPRSGVEDDARLKLAGLGGDNYFWKLGLSSNRYYGMPWKFTLALKSELNFVQEFASSETVPVQERLFGGGQNSVRGFDEGGISPRVNILYHPDAATTKQEDFTIGGEAQWTGNLELRYPINTMVFALGFVDAGDVYNQIGDFSLSSYRASAGAGVRVNLMNSMVIKLDLGMPLKKEPGDDTQVVHFSFGGSF